MTREILISLGGLLLMAGSASAQVPPTAPPYHPAIDNPQIARSFARTEALNSAAMRAERFDQQIASNYLDRQMAYWRETHNPRRIRRAEAAADLINGGNCDAAVALARQDGDERLEVRITQVCASIEISAPAQAAARGD